MLFCQRNKKDSMGESGQIITWVHVLQYLQHISDKQTQPYNKLQLKIIFPLSLTSPLQALNSAAHDNQNLWMHHKPGFPFTWCTPTFLSVLVNSTTGNSPNKSYSRPWKVLGNIAIKGCCVDDNHDGVNIFRILDTKIWNYDKNLLPPHWSHGTRCSLLLYLRTWYFSPHHLQNQKRY